MTIGSVHLAALTVATALVLVALRHLPRAVPRTRRRQQVEQSDDRPASLQAIEWNVHRATGTAGRLHYGLRPLLRELAIHRLSRGCAVDLDTDPAAARHELGEDLYELVRPDRRPPEDRLGPGIAPDDLARVVETLEQP